jgi:exonuclease SbcC
VRLLELSLRNFRQFEQVDLELPARVIGVFGENGSGKSTLMESIAFALYGVDAARTKKQEIRTHGVLTDCEARLVFEHGGQTFEVRRALKGKGSAPEAELSVGDLLLASGVSDVDEQIQHLLHMDLRVFRASVYAEQKQLDAFSEVTPGKRKEMALRLLGIRPVDEARTAARREARTAKQSAEQLAPAVADLGELEALRKEAGDTAKEAAARAKEASAALGETEERSTAARKAFEASDRIRQRVEQLTRELETRTETREQLTADRDGLIERIERAETELAELPALRAELASLDGVGERLEAARRLTERAHALAALDAALAGMPEVDADRTRAEIDAATSAATAATERAAAARARLEHERAAVEGAQERLDRAAQADPSQPCPTCGRELGADFTGYVKHCREEVAAAKTRLAAATKEGTAAEAEAKRAESARRDAAAAGETALNAARERARLEQEAVALRTEVAGLAEAFGQERPDLPALERSVARERDLRTRVAALGEREQQLERLHGDLVRASERLEELQRKLDELTAEADGLAFDAQAHARSEAELAEADVAAQDARRDERASASAAADADRALSRLDGEIAQAKETAARVDDLRSEGRYLERTAMLLDGFRDHLVQRVGPELSREAEALFRDLTNHEYDDLRIDDETLAIHIADGDAYFPIERFSGSETDLANLALRVAISMHLSRVSGADVGMMVLDEVLASLDQERKDLMVQAMGRLASRFHQLFVITHAEQVKDQFPASIVVSKVGRRRSVVTLV